LYGVASIVESRARAQPSTHARITRCGAVKPVDEAIPLDNEKLEALRRKYADAKGGDVFVGIPAVVAKARAVVGQGRST
jgi:hypothetical protein